MLCLQFGTSNLIAHLIDIIVHSSMKGFISIPGIDTWELVVHWLFTGIIEKIETDVKLLD